MIRLALTVVGLYFVGTVLGTLLLAWLLTSTLGGRP